MFARREIVVSSGLYLRRKDPPFQTEGLLGPSSRKSESYRHSQLPYESRSGICNSRLAGGVVVASQREIPTMTFC